MSDEKKVSMAEAIKDLNKKYDQNLVVKMGDKFTIEAFPTNSYSLDYVFGCGGVPKGRAIEIFGQESSGKTTLALYLIAQIQKQGGKAMFIDVEHSLSQEYAKKLGVNVDELYMSQPDTGEQAFDVIEKVAETGGIDIIVLDSVASLVSAKELEDDIEKDTVALQARLMSKGLRRVTGLLAKTKTTVIFINQIRDKIGVYWGNKTTTSGGRALKYYSSTRLEVKKGEKIKGKNDAVIGNWLNICAVKNKVGEPWRVTELELLFGKGVDLVGDVLDSAVKEKIVDKTGGTFTYGEVKLAVGRDHAKKFLEEHPEVLQEITNKLNNKNGEVG